MTDAPIGILVLASRVLCLACAARTGEHGSHLYRVNVAPYGQSCHACGATLVHPRTPAWPTLFPVPRGT